MDKNVQLVKTLLKNNIKALKRPKTKPKIVS